MSFKILAFLLISYLSTGLVKAQSVNETIEVSGSVWTKLEDEKEEPLIGAHILAYGKDSVVLGQGVSDALGNYRFFSSISPYAIAMSYVGFETLSITDFTLTDHKINLERQYLTARNLLDEALITGSVVQRNINSEEYSITNEMRAKATNTLELLDQIHGVRYDKLSNSIRVGNETKVLILVDNMEQSSDYINHLNPNRIAKVSVSKNPKGRYQSDGYEAVINVILKTQYEGYDVLLNNFGIANLSGNNGSSWLMSNQPSTNIVYTNRKVNIYANYTYMLADWNMPIERSVDYKGVKKMVSERIDKKSPNDIYRYHANALSTGVNYKLHENHSLSLQGRYLYENTDLKTGFNYRTDDFIQANHFEESTLVKNHTKQDDYTISLYYTGKIKDKLRIYSDLTYNRYNNRVGNLLTLNTDLVGDNQYKDIRDFIRYNVDFSYQLNDQLGLSFGYSTNYRKYKSKTINKEPLLDYKELRHKGYSYLQYNPSDKFGLEVGTGVEYIDMGETGHSKTYWKLLPTLEANYTPTDYLNIRGSYLTRLNSPTLSQLSPVVTFIDPLMAQVGSPGLKSALRHSISLDINFWSRLTFTPQLRYSPDVVSDYYYKVDQDFRLTYKNMDLKEYSLQMIYDQPLGKYFSTNLSATYYYNKIKYEGAAHSTDGWQIDAELNYFNPKQKLMLQLGYYRSMDKSVQLQGYQMLNLDSWVFSANKSFFKDKVSVMLGYFLPLKWGVRDQQRRLINTPFYSESYEIGLRPYRNTLMLRVSFRLNKGKARYLNNKTAIDREQRINRTFDL